MLHLFNSERIPVKVGALLGSTIGISLLLLFIT